MKRGRQRNHNNSFVASYKQSIMY